MKRAMFVLGLALAGSVTIAPGAWAAFECPRPVGGPVAASDVAKLLPAGDPLDNPLALNAAVDALRKQGLGAPLIIDALVGAYCPTVAGDPALSDAARTARVRTFAAQITRVAYALLSEDEVILDVPFSPATLAAIRAKAKAANLSPETFIAAAAAAAAK